MASFRAQLTVSFLLGILAAHAVPDEGFQHAIEILEPASDSMHKAGKVSVRYQLHPGGEGWPSKSNEVAVGISLDGGEILGAQTASACKYGRDIQSCIFNQEVNLEEEGQHLLSVRLLNLVAEGDGAWDAVWEASVPFEIAPEVKEKMVPDVAGMSAPSAGGNTGPRIVFEAPSRRWPSFLDPSDVTIKFHVLPAKGFAEVEVSGRLVAMSIDVSVRAEVQLPPVNPGEYAVKVFLTDASGTRTGVSEVLDFFVWPDHSWTRHTTAEGSGLSRTIAGEEASFVITARDASGVLSEGGEHFVVRLLGPSIVSASVEHEGRAEYRVSYMVAEEGLHSLHVELHYDKSAGYLDFGDENQRDVIGWNIQGSPFQVAVSPSRNGLPPQLHPHVPVPLCEPLSGDSLAGRWVSRSYCTDRGLDCWSMEEEDDDYMWLPWRCRLRGFSKADLSACGRDGDFNVLMAGTSQQRTLFFDVGKLLGSTQNQPRKYWTDMEATDVTPNLFFHWMIPGYDNEGFLDYEALISELNDFVRKYSRGSNDVLVVQASVHDIHLGTLQEYGAHIDQMARYLASTGLRVIFRGGDALHIPPGPRSIIERGLRDPRIRKANDEAHRAMARQGIIFVDTHASTIGRPDKCIDGYHYFDRDTALLDKLGLEICIGNAVARTQAQILLNFICPPKNETGHLLHTKQDEL